MMYGYARDTGDHDLECQLVALLNIGCDSITTESSKSAEDLACLLSKMNSGDSLVVWRLDKAADSVVKLNQLVESLLVRGVSLQSVNEKVNTTLDADNMIQAVIAKMADVERMVKSLS
ncbi:hypothetical protein A6D98_09900 [Aliivibrio fischeri]|uniref:Recombinase n=1 Tax=Aliivibrio phage vB_Alvi_H905 TaxID=3234039 RepID=A0AB39C9S7_9VIRU|nr:recombinase family protein [Aliivibrio fischeri]OCH60903.1 hypothetical protein A6D98_09900 [Aliivibrio fischeri]